MHEEGLKGRFLTFVYFVLAFLVFSIFVLTCKEDSLADLAQSRLVLGELQIR